LTSRRLHLVRPRSCRHDPCCDLECRSHTAVHVPHNLMSCCIPTLQSYALQCNTINAINLKTTSAPTVYVPTTQLRDDTYLCCTPTESQLLHRPNGPRVTYKRWCNISIIFGRFLESANIDRWPLTQVMPL